MKSAFFLLLSALPLVGLAQATPTQAELLQRGELTGSRRANASSAQSRTATAARRAATPAADPLQQHLLGTQVNLAQAPASQLPDLYESFIAVTRDERRTWAYSDWDAAGQVLTRLNQRYEEVRTELPLEERLRIRSFQGEFRTLRGARSVKDKLD